MSPVLGFACLLTVVTLLEPIDFLSQCVDAHTLKGFMEVTGQLARVSSLSIMWVQGMELGHRSWGQMSPS